MKVLLFGASGQVGQALYGPLYQFVQDLSGIMYMPKSSALDLRDSQEVLRYVKSVRPDLIINAAAYTSVDGAELEKEDALAVNFGAPTAIASVASTLGAYLVHYSTDYVFDGLIGAPYTETSIPNPVNHYGYTKWLADCALMSFAGLRGVILRTSWVYSPRRSGRSNFYRKICEMYAEGAVPAVVTDQIGCPTSSDALAECTMRVVQKDSPRLPMRILNAACSGSTSWWGFAAEIARLHGWEPPKKIKTADYKTAAARPGDTSLLCARLQSGGIYFPDWVTALQAVVQKDSRN